MDFFMLAPANLIVMFVLIVVFCTARVLRHRHLHGLLHAGRHLFRCVPVRDQQRQFHVRHTRGGRRSARRPLSSHVPVHVTAHVRHVPGPSMTPSWAPCDLLCRA